MKIGDPAFIKFKKSLMDQGANYETDEEYIEAFNNLVGYFEVLIQMDQEQKNKEEQADS